MIYEYEFEIKSIQVDGASEIKAEFLKIIVKKKELNSIYYRQEAPKLTDKPADMDFGMFMKYLILLKKLENY